MCWLYWQFRKETILKLESCSRKGIFAHCCLWIKVVSLSSYLISQQRQTTRGIWRGSNLPGNWAASEIVQQSKSREKKPLELLQRAACGVCAMHQEVYVWFTTGMHFSGQRLQNHPCWIRHKVGLEQWQSGKQYLRPELPFSLAP